MFNDSCCALIPKNILFVVHFSDSAEEVNLDIDFIFKAFQNKKHSESTNLC